MQIHYGPAIQDQHTQLAELKALIDARCGSLESTGDGKKEVKMLRVGDRRPLIHFLSDKEIRLVRVILNPVLESAQDCEYCLIFRRVPEKTSSNEFLRLPDSTHQAERKISDVINRPGVSNLFIESYVTRGTSRYFVLFWEQDDEE